MKVPSNGVLANSGEAGERKTINSELWHACAGPLVSLPPVGSVVVYFPQGHSEQVAASMQKDTDGIPSYPNLPSKIICVLHNVTLHADLETDEVYAQMTLQPVNKCDKEALLASDMGLKQNKQPTEFFCKTLTASDTSTHGGFSVPRRAAEKIFPPLDFSMQPPAQELVARDLHDVAWTFRHIYRGQPKRHLLTTGWSVFVSTKRLYAGDSVLFIRDERSQLLLGIRRANRQQPALSSSVISSDSMHIGILAAAAHASANNSPFTIFYNPRACKSEFVIPIAKYNKAMYSQVSLGMRFRMMFETEESGVRRYMGTITGISDLDPIRWKGSQWRNLQVGWDESAAGERPSRVSIWEIEPVATPFYLCPPPFFRPKFPKQPGMPDEESDMENAFKRAVPWLGDDLGIKDVQNPMFPGLSLVQWMSMQQNPQFSAMQPGVFPPMSSSASSASSAPLHNNFGTNDPSKILNFQSQAMTSPTPSSALAAPDIQLNIPQTNQNQQIDQFHQPNQTWSQQQQRQTIINLQQQRQLPQQLQPQHNQQQQQQQHQQLQQHHQQQPLQQPPQQQPQALQQQHPLQQQLPKHQPPHDAQQQQQQQHHQQQLLRADVNNAVAVSQSLNQNLQQPIVNSQLQQQPLSTTHIQSQQNMPLTNQNPQQSASLLQDLQLQQQLEQQQCFLQRQIQQLPLSQHQQLQLLQKLQQQQQQQQQQQLLSQVSSPLHPQLQQQQPVLQQQGFQQNQQFQQQQQQLSSPANFSSSIPNQQPKEHLGQQNPPASIRHHSSLTDGDAPSCSTSPSTNNCQVLPSNFLNRMHQSPAILTEESVVQPSSNLVQELHNNTDGRIKHEVANPKETDQLVYRSAITDPLEATSSATSYCLDGNSLQQSFSLPSFCLEGEVQADPPNNLLFGVNIDGLTPDALLSRRFGSGKDLQNLLSNYGGNEREIETEVSTAGISSQSFGIPEMPFKAGCSNDAGKPGINENGVLNRGLWGNQASQRMRTFTKVQKRGSVGRSIDVTRYKGYDELRHDLARMFGIEGQLDDPHRSEWKLVYVDHENDILLVGDDPWEEFVSCVQSIKILSSAEVQQMSLDGDLGNVQVHTQACSGSGSGNAWRGNYDDNSVASFDR